MFVTQLPITIAIIILLSVSKSFDYTMHLNFIDVFKELIFCCIKPPLFFILYFVDLCSNLYFLSSPSFASLILFQFLKLYWYIVGLRSFLAFNISIYKFSPKTFLSVSSGHIRWNVTYMTIRSICCITFLLSCAT